MATDSSMKSSESRPSEPSTPLGSVVSSVISAARRGSNFSRSTTSPFSSSRTSFCVINATSVSRRAAARVGSLRAPVEPRMLSPPASRQLDRPRRRPRAPLAQIGERARREALAPPARSRPARPPRADSNDERARAPLQPQARRGLHQRPPIANGGGARRDPRTPRRSRPPAPAPGRRCRPPATGAACSMARSVAGAPPIRITYGPATPNSIATSAGTTAGAV